MVIGKEAFPTLRDPSHRPTEFAGGIEDEHILRVSTALHAE